MGQVKRPAERKRLKRQGEDRDPGREKASGAKQLQEALFGTGEGVSRQPAADSNSSLLMMQSAAPATSASHSCSRAEKQQSSQWQQLQHSLQVGPSTEATSVIQHQADWLSAAQQAHCPSRAVL
jgi:hypothetical protein